MSKRALIIVLGGANVLLLAGLMFSAMSMPRAMAQPAAATGGSMIAVTSRIDADIDALYLLDIQQGRLNVLIPRREDGQLGFVTQRNIQEDFKAFSEAVQGKTKAGK